jgi:hypothetical protein
MLSKQEQEHVNTIHAIAAAIGTTPARVADVMDDLHYSPELFSEGEPLAKGGDTLADAFRQRLARDRTRTHG